MKKSFIFLFLIFVHILVVAQKKPLCVESDLTWPTISNHKISNNGKYVCYVVKSIRDGSKLIIKSTDNKWLKEMEQGTGVGTFSENNRLLLFSKGRDSLGILDIQKQSISYIYNLSSYSIAPVVDGKYLAYCVKSLPKELIVRNLSTGKEMHYPDISVNTFSPKGNILLLQKVNQEKGVSDLFYLDINTGKLFPVGNYNSISDFVFDDAEKQLIFLTKQVNTNESVFRYYQPGLDSAMVLISPSSIGMNNLIITNGRNAFSSKGDKFFFNIENRKPVNRKKDSLLISNDVNIWHYKDDSLDFIQNRHPLLAVVHMMSKDTVVKLTNVSDVTIWNYNIQNNGEYLLVTSNFYGNEAEYRNRLSANPDLYMISTKDGSRTLIKHCHVGNEHQFSASGKYVIWFDVDKKQWFTYNITTKVTKNITGNIFTEMYIEDDQPGYARPVGVAGWLAGDTAVLIYDRNDIWKINPDGIGYPLCITYNYGIKNNIRFRNVNLDLKNDESIVLKNRLLLTAFNTKTKENGFYRLSLNKKHVLTKLIMSPHLYYRWWTNPIFSGFQEPILPVKARNADKCIISRQAFNSSVNLFVTSNFKDFIPISSIHPERNYNWYTAELVKWNLSDGEPNEGILYKPENFDSVKKYPVLFHYYEQNASALNGFMTPSLSIGGMSIPWYVSNGYLVFVPDIHFETGHPGQSAYNAVVSAAQHLSKYSWVNPNKMGLQGHSHGSFETNYIITHSSLFAAASSNSGTSDIVGAYGKMNNRSGRGQWYYETAQGRIGASLWQNPDSYIENSSIFRANFVNTPILIMHNKNDGSVPFDQGTEWFSHLSYLGKKSWFISYDGEGHTIDGRKNQLDYTIRLQQFFDHYLKDKPAPVWMTRGVSDEDKGIISGLELDNPNKIP
jgi:dienelactone hydrolase